MIGDLKNVRKILFVCTGNICRSAMAEMLFLDRLRREGPADIELKSAGVAATAGAPAPDEVVRVLAKAGVVGTEHRARLLSEELVRWADLILTMDGRHQMAVALQHPGAVGKTHVLKSFVGAEGRRDIADPIGQPQKVYEACAAEIHGALEKLAEKLRNSRSGG